MIHIIIIVNAIFHGFVFKKLSKQGQELIPYQLILLTISLKNRGN